MNKEDRSILRATRVVQAFHTLLLSLILVLLLGGLNGC